MPNESPYQKKKTTPETEKYTHEVNWLTAAPKLNAGFV